MGCLSVVRILASFKDQLCYVTMFHFKPRCGPWGCFRLSTVADSDVSHALSPRGVILPADDFTFGILGTLERVKKNARVLEAVAAPPAAALAVC